MSRKTFQKSSFRKVRALWKIVFNRTAVRLRAAFRFRVSFPPFPAFFHSSLSGSCFPQTGKISGLSWIRKIPQQRRQEPELLHPFFGIFQTVFPHGKMPQTLVPSGFSGFSTLSPPPITTTTFKFIYLFYFFCFRSAENARLRSAGMRSDPYLSLVSFCVAYSETAHGKFFRFSAS